MSSLPWEDSLLERKVESDLKDLLKTIVAFANSVKPGHTAVILIGEKDDGTVQGVRSPDNIQKSVRDLCNKVYPPVLSRSVAYEQDGKTCVRVEIEYDGDTPHFGDAAWIRRGSSTEKASDEVFQTLIELRLGKVRELAKWIDKPITVEPNNGTLFDIDQGRALSYNPRYPKQTQQGILTRVNSFWTSFHLTNIPHSEPLEKVVLSWDDKNNRLKILVKP